MKYTTLVMILCLFSLCLGQNPLTELKPLTLEIGTTHTFEFYQDGSYIGYNTYTVTKKELYNEKEAYFIDSVSELNIPSLMVHVEASYVVDTNGRCLHYELSATVNDEIQTMKSDFSEGSVHFTATTPRKTYDENVRVGLDTFTLDNNMIDQWQIMFSAVTLARGGSLRVNMFAAQPMKAAAVSASIGKELVTVEASGKTWQCLRLTFSAPSGCTMYVTEDARLIKVENDTGLVITLKE